MKKKSIPLLKSEVEKKFGRRVLSSADCKELCDDILRASSTKISFNTIRRIFNLMKADTSPSIQTLNILSNYCGFSSYDYLINLKKQSAIIDTKVQNKPLLEHLTLIFKEIDVRSKNDTTYLSVVQQTILQLQKTPFIIDDFQKEIAKTINGQTFYFEQFVFIDQLNGYYGKGLHYYLNEKKTKEAQAFGHSLLCFRSWLNADNEGVKTHYINVMNYEISNISSSAVGARFFTTQLYYANLFGLDEESIIVKAKHFFFTRNRQNENRSCLNCFEIILSEALLLIGQFTEAMFYIDQLLKEVKKGTSSYIDVSIYENICLFKAIVLAHNKKGIKANDILKGIDHCKFSFLSKKYLNLLYLSLKQNLPGKKEEKEQIRNLIQETGFSRLLTFGEKVFI
jgi:hypothetical protein